MGKGEGVGVEVGNKGVGGKKRGREEEPERVGLREKFNILGRDIIYKS